MALEAGVTFHGFEAQRLTRDGRLRDVSIGAGPFEIAKETSTERSRMGGDELLFLLTGVDDERDVEGIARRMLAELDRSLNPSGNELFVTRASASASIRTTRRIRRNS